ncbi:MAG: hypothetical protein WC865_18290 [Bacteroidales bacterium]
MKRFLKIGIPILLLLLAVMLWYRFCFVFGEGVRAGNLNFLVKKGYVFKTWEGRLIQVGFKTPAPGAMQSNEFDFSVANDSLGALLERSSGKFIEVRYKEYLHSLPWRGMSRYVVVEVLKVGDPGPASLLPY